MPYFILFCVIVYAIILMGKLAVDNWKLSVPIVAIITFLVLQHKSAKKKAAQENEERRIRADREAWKKRRKDEYDNSQDLIRKRLGTLSANATSALESIPGAVASANRALDKAEEEYGEGVFAPFWDAVETALNCLTRYDEGVRIVTENTTHFAKESKTLDSSPPPFIPNDSTIPDATRIVERLRAVVRKAQKVPDFAKIYEMRRTNSLLVAGFANLGSAIESMGGRISESINGLADTLDSAITSMSEQNAEYYRESLSAIQGVRDRLASDSEAQRQHAANRDLEILPWHTSSIGRVNTTR